MSLIQPLIQPEYMLFAQHGWADDNRAMRDLACRLVTDITPVIAPNLGYVQTWLRIEPLIQAVETIALDHLTRYPHLPIRILGHSMGGLIWLEVLYRHPEWWSRVHSLVLIGSPVGGADLGRIIDPLKLGIGIAADLGTDRKPIAEKIAAVIPTLSIAGNSDGGSDGTVPICTTQFANAQFICLPGLAHAALRNHTTVVAVIQDFWLDTTIGEAIADNDIIKRLRSVPGITDGHWRGFDQAQVIIPLNNGASIRIWRNLMGIEHVFLASPEGTCLYAGFVGWLHQFDLHQAIKDIYQAYAVS